MSDKISVVITTYKRDSLFKECLNSVLAQSKRPLEIIIVNNYSKPIKIIKNKDIIKVCNLPNNMHVAYGRNIGASLAKGDYVAFLDDDDLWPKSYLENSQIFIKKYSPKIILSKIYVKNNLRFELFKDPSNLTLTDILLKNPGIIGSNIIISKKTFIKLKGYDNSLIPSEDKSICIEAILKKIKIYFQDNYIIYRNQGSDQISKDFKLLYFGTKNFYNKYKSLMSLKIKIYCLQKMYLNKFKTGKYFSIFFIIFFRVLISIIILFKL